MKIDSSYFGELEVNEDSIITFNTPIPGFEEMSRYFMVSEPSKEAGVTENIFCWLHSAEDGDVAFALMDVFKILSDYKPEIEAEYLTDLDYSDGDVVLVYNIINLPEKMDDMTVNLIAPIIINTTKKTGMQIVLSNESYSLKHRIFDDIKRAAELGGKKGV